MAFVTIYQMLPYHQFPPSSQVLALRLCRVFLRLVFPELYSYPLALQESCVHPPREPLATVARLSSHGPLSHPVPFLSLENLAWAVALPFGLSLLGVASFDHPFSLS